MKPVDTRRVRRLLRRRGCELVATEGSHEKWRSPNGRTATIVASDKQQSPGLLRKLQDHFAHEFGPGWLERGLDR